MTQELRAASPLSTPDRTSAWRQSIRFSALLLLACSLLLTTAVQAAEWRYRVRPGDTIWDLSRIHLRADVHWQRLQALNHVEDPWNMPPGTELRFPISWLRVQPVKARVVAVQGEATIHTEAAPGTVDTVRAEMQLAAGSVLRTGPDANLTLSFADGSRLQLHGDSELQLDRLSAWGATGMVDTRLRLLRGRTTNSAQPSKGPASRFVLDTPGTMATVRGTRFRVGHDHDRTRAEVLAGSVQVSSGNQSEMLRAGQGSFSDAGGGPHPPSPLLPAPDLSGWPERIDQVTTTVAWQPVDGAHGYRLQVAPDPEFLTLIVDTLSAGPETRLTAPGDGVFHARVRGLDEHGLEGEDATASFHARAHPSPPFAIAPARASTVAGPRPRLRWTRGQERGLRYRVQVAATADFSSPLFEADGLNRTELRVPSDFAPGDYVWRVAASDGSDHHGPWGDPVHFSLAPATAGPEIGEDGVVRGRRSLEVTWPAGDPDQRYLFQFSRDEDFARVETETLLDENRIVLSDLRSGTWHMRTRLVDSDGYEHPFGPVQSARVGCLPCRIAIAAGLLLVL